MTGMTAHDAFIEILDINETIEELKNRNIGNTVDGALCTAVTLLTNYRTLIDNELENIVLFKHDQLTNII